MMQTTPTEWVQAGSLGLSAISLVALAVAFAPADAGYFDPRYQLTRLVESGRLDWLLVMVTELRTATRDAVLDLAALLILLTTKPQGAMA